MKTLARRFKAHEIFKGRFELRLLSKPVHRYSDEQSGLIDGTAFIWSRGSDPEVLLLIELAQGDAGKPRWQYAFARIGSAELHASLDGEEVWLAPEAFAQPTATRGYALFPERVLRQP
jgi:hypothetical protein